MKTELITKFRYWLEFALLSVSARNVYDIGRTTSDANGAYSLMWEPEVPGKYVVTASFAGSKSYYGSHDWTAVGIGSARANMGGTQTPY